MKKKQTSAVPRIGIPASPSAFKNADVGTSPINAAEMPKVPGHGLLPNRQLALVGAPEIRKVPAEELISKLRKMATGWDSDIEKLFSLPQSLFKIEDATATYYSKKESFGVADALNGLQVRKFYAPLPEYGIGIFSTGGSVQLILIDSARNIIVRGRVFSIHDQTQQKDWAAFKQAINAALAIAPDARKQGGVAVFDGMVKVIKTA